MDPVFFPIGVYIAMHSSCGRLAAKAIAESLAADDDGRACFKAYEKKIMSAMDLYLKNDRRGFTRSRSWNC